MTLALVWVIGADALLLWAARARAAARARGGEASRTSAILAAGALALLVATAALAFAVLPAGSDGERSPARSRLFLHSVELPVPAAGEELRIGWSPNAGLRLPPASQPDEAMRAWNLLTAVRDGKAGARLVPVEPPEKTATALVLVRIAAGDDLAATADRLVARCGDASRAPAPLALAAGDRGLALVCHRGAPLYAFGFADLRAGDKAEPHLRVAPLVRRAGHFQPPQMDVGGGSLIQIGSSAEAAPGIDVWEVPAPPGGTRLLVTPQGLGGCADWRRAVVASDVHSAAVQPDDSSVCVLDFAAPYAMEVRRLVADSGAVALWSFWAAGLIGLPALAWLLWLAAARRSRLTRARLADALAFAWVAAVLAAVASWRLLWAHRIDMLRDYQAGGWRVESNLYWIGLAAAALAATAAARAEPTLSAARRLALAAGAWLLALGLTTAAVSVPASGRALALALVSLALGLAPVAQLRRLPPAILVLCALAGAALLAPSSPGIKMALGWSVVLAFYSAARTRPTAALLAGGLAAGAMLHLDAGITAALVMPGMVVGFLFAARDACFSDGDLEHIGAHRARGLPLAAAHAAIALAVALVLCVWALAAAGPEPGLWLTRAALHLPLLIAACLAPAAALVWRRSGPIAARPWLVAALVASVVWILREPLLDAVLESDSQAAHRIAQVIDPGYALLRSPDRFLAGLTAWRETALPAAGSTWSGQGLFGAQLIDPGVLLSVENDYLPVLVLRETGLAGILATALLLGGLAGGLWLLAGERFRRGDAAGRRRALAALVIGGLVLYQPLAALGALPLTGLPWPGLGLDGASDLFVLLALALWCAAWGESPDQLDVYDAGLRREIRFARVHRLELAAAAVAVAAGLLVLTRAGIAAVSRPAVPAGADRALAYARALGCGDDGVPAHITGHPIDDGTERFHRRLDTGWDRARPAAAARVAALSTATCSGEDPPETCAVRVPLGLPEVEIRVTDGAPRCAVVLPDDTLHLLHLPPARPFRGQRVRLVSRAMGAAARDVGELVSGSLVVRLRPEAGNLRLDPPPSEPAGLFAAGTVQLGGGATLRATDEGARLADPAGATLLLTRGEDGGWQRGVGGASVALDRLALVVVGGGSSSRGVWLFRPRSRWPLDQSGPAVVDPLLADDVGAAASGGRRAYVYGDLLPELGWVNRYRARSSLGLDGWVRVALDERSASGPLAGPPRCGPLDPPPGDLQEVCAVAEDGAVECRVAIQPELAVRLRHLTELVSLLPARFAPRTQAGARLPVAGSFALLRGDTGEILAQGDFVPGRASPLYAPASPAVERQLIRAREDRDVATGKRLPPELRGEASGEKVAWNQPIAVGSAMKPLIARAFERTSPQLARTILLHGAPFAGASCRGGKAHAILGHCPPTDSLWNHREEMGVDGFLSRSANWYMAALGLVGTALPEGKVGFGDAEVPLSDLLARDVGDHAPEAALWTEQSGRRVVTARHTVDLAALREAPMWKNFESVWGRPLCLLGDKESCRRAAERGDLCAARALPIAEPTPDLRHLVALGPAGFDFHPSKGGGENVATFEYLQFLRGSGVHALGSLLQLTDAFNRIAYEDAPGAKGYRLAASWFPVPRVTSPPRTDCSRTAVTGDPVRDGLCDVVRSGTASRALAELLADPGVVVYGAKTGTIDSLADIAERPAACARFNQAHTLPDRPARADQQPYWLDCGAKATTPDDSLLLISFGVPTPRGGMVPLTLGLRFQRAGAGFASEVSPHFIAAVRDYFAAEKRRLP